jgi:hypothetical protein
MERMLRIIGGALNYRDDLRYFDHLSEGVMPHGKLVKLMGLSARPMSQLATLAVEGGLVCKQVRRNRPYPVTVYTLPAAS